MLDKIIGAASSIIGGIIGNQSRDKQAAANNRLQREYAQSGIQWKVADAKAAGIHPIYALGAPTTSYQSQPLGDSLGPAISNAGQDIGRAVNSTSSPTQRMTAYSQAAQALQLERGALENELLKSQVARSRQTPNPAIPSATQSWGVDGQGETANMDPAPIKEEAKRASWDPRNPHHESHAISDLGYARTPAGGWFPIPSKDVKERIEDIEPAELAWFLRNNVPQALGMSYAPPFAAPRDKEWYYSVLNGYMLRDLGTGERPNHRRIWGTSTWLSK